MNTIQKNSLDTKHDKNITRQILSPHTPWKTLIPLLVAAEDIQFSPEQSKTIAPRLLQLAYQHRHPSTNNTLEKFAVLSAIRTGAAMLKPHQTELLLPFLKTLFISEPTKVAIKMLGRIYEAQPAKYMRTPIPAIEQALRRLSKPLLRPDKLNFTSYAAIIQLSFYALVTMGSPESLSFAQKIQKLPSTCNWFKTMTANQIYDLQEQWKDKTVAQKHLNLIQANLDLLRKQPGTI